jgi:hypothetical protein
VTTVVWTDGSCNANGVHGRGGWAALIEQAGTIRELSGSAHGTTHNRRRSTSPVERSAAPPLEAKSRLCSGFVNGSDGTRTRDLRRDRPVQAQPPQLAPTQNYRLEQAFPTSSNRL